MVLGYIFLAFLGRDHPQLISKKSCRKYFRKTPREFCEICSKKFTKNPATFAGVKWIVQKYVQTYVLNGFGRYFRKQQTSWICWGVVWWLVLGDVSQNIRQGNVGEIWPSMCIEFSSGIPRNKYFQYKRSVFGGYISPNFFLPLGELDTFFFLGDITRGFSTRDLPNRSPLRKRWMPYHPRVFQGIFFEIQTKHVETYFAEISPETILQIFC